MKIYEHKIMDFDLQGDRIDSTWKPKAEKMSDRDFQYCILRYASFSMEHGSKKVLIDLSEFRFKPSEASGQFHAEYMTKIYNLIGVTKKVFVAPFMENKVVGKEPDTGYDNAFMQRYEEAVAWLDQT